MMLEGLKGLFTKRKELADSTPIKDEGKPKTIVIGGAQFGNYSRDFFNGRSRNQSSLAKWTHIYTEGGMVAEAIDAYSLYALGQGFRLEGDPKVCEAVQTMLEKMNFISAARQMITDAIVYGTGYVELVKGRGNYIVKLQPMPGEQMEIRADKNGTIMEIIQIAGQGKDDVVRFKPEQVMTFHYNKLGGRIYGESLIGRAYDDIMRDAAVSEASATAIERHGFRRYQVKVGMPGETVNQDTMIGIQRKFETLKPKHDFVTPADVEIKSIDEGNLGGVAEYGNWSIMRLCTALGVPEEMLGLGRGSTEATANVRLQGFYVKIAQLQHQFAEQVQSQLIDLLAGKPGICKLSFPDVSAEDEVNKMAYVKGLLTISAADPYTLVSRQWALSYLGIEDDEQEENDTPENQQDDA